MLSHFNALPPFLCVAIARVGRRRKTLVEITAASGLSLRKVERLAPRLSWDDVKLRDVAAFSKACGVDMICQHEARRYLSRQAGVQTVLSHLSSKQLIRFTALMDEFRARSKQAPSTSEA